MTITPRDRHFDFSNTPKHWLNNDPYLTHMLNASSPAFPFIEAFVIQSVQHYLPHITDINLYNDCKHFIQQEANHAREHVAYNTMLKNQGYLIQPLQTRIKQKLSYIKKHWSPLSRLAISLGFECFTTMLSKTILQKSILKHCPHSPADFWHWHLVEELEHKHVLFNLYQHVGGSYIRRICFLTLVMVGYCYYAMRLFCQLLQTDRLSLLIGIKNLFYKNVFFLRSIIKTFRCYSTRFSPTAL